MDELRILSLQACTAIIVIECLSIFFPEKEGILVRGITILSVIAVLAGGILQQDWSSALALPETDIPDISEQSTAYAQAGTALLRKRLLELLSAADIQVSEEPDGLEIRYRQHDDGTIDIDDVYVCVRFASDRDRAFALLQSVLTEAVPLYVHSK